MLSQMKSNKAIWIMVSLLVIIIIAILLAIYSQSSVQNMPSPVTTEPQPPIAKPLTEQQLVEIAEISTSDTDQEFSGLVDDSLVEQPVAKDSALIKEELDQLKDIQQQLNEQKGMLIQQHLDADQILALKEQQLNDLEKRLQVE